MFLISCLYLFVAVYSASLNLAYKDLSLEDARRENKAKNLDPHKAAQFERLGMAYSGTSRSVCDVMASLVTSAIGSHIMSDRQCLHVNTCVRAIDYSNG